MNIFILNWRDPKHPLAGGAEISLLEHAKYWQKKGANITWFASSFPGAKAKERLNGITYLRKGSHFTVHFWVFVYFLQNKKAMFDVVIDCFHFLPFFTPLYMKQAKIIGLIHEIAGEVWFKNLPLILATIGYHLEPYFFKIYKHVQFITVSESTKNDLRVVGIAASHVEVIHNGFRAPKMIRKWKRNTNPTILFLGKIAADKGIKDAIEAYKKVLEIHHNVELWVAGKEEKKGTWGKIISNTTSQITYFGFVPEEKKWELLQKAWVLIHPSTREGWGLTVIEANSVGTPVIGYDVAGLRDSIQHNKTGLLVDPSPEGLTKGIEKILYQKRLGEKFAHAATNWSKNFSWEKAGKESWAILKDIHQV